MDRDAELTIAGVVYDTTIYSPFTFDADRLVKV